MSYKASGQADDVMPPRLSAVWCQTVDVTARPYQIALLQLGSPPTANVGSARPDHVYLTLHADGGDIYYQFASATSSALVYSAVNAVGVALTPATAMTSAMGMRIPSGAFVPVRINRAVDKWIILQTAAGTATLRLYASSQAEG